MTEYTFSSSEGGTITVGGSRSSDNSTAVADNMTVTFADLEDRASQIGMRRGKELEAPLNFLTRDAQECNFPNLSTIEGQNQIESLIKMRLN